MSIKLIIFDFDGVLCDLVEVHYEALNKALLQEAGKQFVINREEQNTIYNGLSTKTKLNKLHESKGLNTNLFNKIYSLKQELTQEAIDNNITLNQKLIDDLSKLKSEGYTLCCASNAISETVHTGLAALGLLSVPLFSLIYGNEDIKRQKPNPDIYLQCMIDLGFDPSETLIVEDSAHGRTAAVRSGAHVCTVDNVHDTTYEYISERLNKIQTTNIKWVDNKMNIVLPMAGLGSRFSVMGYELIKPLISVNGIPMIQKVVENLNTEANYTFIVQQAHYKQYNLGYLLPLIVPNCNIVQLDGLTEGAACSVLAAKKYINNDNKLFIINSDQYVDMNFSYFFNAMLTSDCDGSIICFNKENDPKWSYAKTNEDGVIIDVKEKNPISNIATIGAYFWKSGSDFIQSAEDMIDANDRTNNEFYLAPTFNYLINKNKKIIPYMIETKKFWSLGTPEDLEHYLKNN